ncbi:MAG: glycine--tRNA ligase subunit beta [Magnetococcales bacterium]|nr:glycine--tRNA ligase subunit beta [Magnetococcales bacterium]
MSELLFEIGCEEIPARMLPEAIAQLGATLRGALEQNGLWDEKSALLWCDGTPRRLSVALDGVRGQQPDSQEERRGPPVERAFDAQGNPTQAAIGFARVCGVAVAELATIQTPKGNYLGHTVRLPGSGAGAILPGLLAGLLTSFSWPKSMRWGAGQMRFVRPIRWMVALLDGEVIPVTTADGLVASNQTMGHRFMAPGPFAVESAAGYLKILADSRVMLPLEARRKTIREAVERIAVQAGGRAILDDALLTENAGLAEWPVPMPGRFDPKYLEIPKEVLTTSMKYHQKYFPVQAGDGTLLPCFVAVANLEVADPAVLVRGYERVLRARLEDAAFYWREDRQTPLPERLDALRQVVFQVRLGTLHQKALRMATLAGHLAEWIQPDVPGALASRAATLAKCDLVTGMVGEFPELQGIMGGYYALHADESPLVARAIREHYRPQGPGDALPETPLGRIVSLSDKLDTLTGCFGIGLAPTGTRDPFGLRRAALGVIRMILDGAGLRLPLRRVLGVAHGTFAPGVLEQDLQATSTAILEFFYGRLQVYLRRDFDHDLIDAVQALGKDDLYDVVARVRALAQFKRLDSFAALVAANKRIANLLNKAASEDRQVEVDQARLLLPAETGLFAAVTRCAQQTDALLVGRDYGGALGILATLRQPIDQFFADVLVMDPDGAIRRNRLALLHLIRETFGRIADVSRLELPGEG